MINHNIENNIMIQPVRCFTCGKVLNNLYYEDIEEFNKLRRYCCKRMILTNVNLIDKILNYGLEKKACHNESS